MFYTYIYFAEEDSSIPSYVGKGKGGRFLYHLKDQRSSYWLNHLRSSIKKGIQIKIEITKIFEDELDAFAEERRLISLFGRKDLGTGSLFNKTDGGDGLSGVKRSQEHQDKLTKALIGKKHRKHKPRGSPSKETLDKIAKAKTGKKYQISPDRILAPRPPHRQETITKMAEVKIGNRHASKRCTVDGVKIYESVKALGAELGFGKDGKGSPSFKYL